MLTDPQEGLKQSAPYPINLHQQNTNSMNNTILLPGNVCKIFLTMERESSGFKNLNLNIAQGEDYPSIWMQKPKTKEYECNQKNQTNI